MVLTDEQKLEWIANANYEELLAKWRNEPLGSDWFLGEVGAAYQKRFRELSNATSHEEKVAASKSVGWSL